MAALNAHLLVTTLGTTWAVVPEAHGIFTNLYGPKHPSPAPPPTAIWVVTTHAAWEKAEAPLHAWARLAGVSLRPFIRPEDDLSTEVEVHAMRELIFRVVLRASEQSTELSCSLAGGRKTMSADMQEAARTFGCARLLHVLSNGNPADWPEALRQPAPEVFCRPLKADIRQWLLPVVLPGSNREDLLDVPRGTMGPVQTADFPVEEPNTLALTSELQARRADKGLLTNFIAAIEQDEHHENWRSLYRLPPRHIARLRETPLSPDHRELLRRLPKAELHCHIGGILNLPQQRTVADAIRQTLSPAEQAEAFARVKTIDWQLPDARWREQLKAGHRSANVAAVFAHFDDATLETILFPPHIERIALKTRHPLGFSAYELPGELSGSAVLGHPAALAPTAAGILEFCRKEGVHYLELRGSPQKYRPENPQAWLRDFKTTWDKRNRDSTITLRFIWIADRRQKESLPTLVAQAARARQTLGDFLVGIDLAGDESINSPEQLAPHFAPAFEACLPITIHAGEGETARNIWDAAYHLHADRIGHGLTLHERPDLLTRFVDRDICLELCPTSNREVVGFRDPAHPATSNCPTYPLADLWGKGLSLTICTDNPGISRTTPADEFLAAARMIGRLTLWDSLALIKQGFNHAFVPRSIRETLIKQADLQIHAQISRHLNSP